MAKTLTEDNFSEFINGSTPVLVDFWAPWCGPCAQQSPVLEELEGAGFATGKVDVDKCQGLAAEYQVRSIPTLIAFKEGKEINRRIGLTAQEELEEMLRQ